MEKLFIRFIFFSFLFVLYSVKIEAETGEALEKRAIRGGKVASEGQFPYAVSLKLYGGGISTCTAILLTSESVLTAAHCAYFDDGTIRDHRRINGYVGSIELHKGEMLIFKEFRIHPNYHYPHRFDDLAIFVTSRPVRMGNTIKPVPVAIPKKELYWSTIVVMGWGSTAPGSQAASQYLNYVNAMLVEFKECKEDIPYFRKTEFCYGHDTRGGAVGDSGGPLVLPYNGKDVLVGVHKANYGVGYRIAQNLGEYLQWLNEAAVGKIEYVHVN